MNHQESMAVEILHYNRWANLALLDVFIPLSAGQLASTAPGTYGTVYDTLEHIIRAEAGYYRRLTGTRLQPPFSWDERPPLESVRPYAEQVSSALLDAVEQMRSGDLVEEENEGEVFRYKPLTFFIQIINHGVEHRTNITTILQQMGIEPPEIDGWGYMMANQDRLGP
jgi:uncharacterized damage-inducible protein DinB